MLYFAVILPFIMYFVPIKNKNTKLIISILPALYIILFRYSLGTDYFSYEFLYNQHNIRSLAVALNSHTNLMEAGFRFLIYIFKSLSLPYHVFAATISLVIYMFFILWIKDNQVEKQLQITLLNGMFFVVWALSGLRQGLVLSIGTYLFFSKKDKLNPVQSLVAIFILAQFHVSAYIYLGLLVIKKLKLSQKQLTLTLTLSLIFTILPYQKLLLPYESIEIIRRFLKYSSNNLGFWDFSGLIRLSFGGFILVFYKTFKKDAYIKTLADTSILGFSLYFVLKSSEVVASRINIYTFILIIPLLVFLIVNKFNTRYIKILASLSILGFSLVYLQKDLINHQKEVSSLWPQKVYKMKNILNTDLDTYLTYDNVYPFLTYQAKYCKINKEIKLSEDQDFSQDYFIVKDKKTSLYGLISGSGKWLIKPEFKARPTLLNDIIEVEIDKKLTYLDLDGQVLTGVQDQVDIYKERALAVKDEVPEKTLVEYTDFKDQLDRFFPNKDVVDEVAIISYKLPFKHKLLRVTYVNRHNFFILDDNLNIKNEMLYKSAIRFGLNNMAYGNTYCGYVALNSSGEIVWIDN